ncbi:MAG TPA: hypothetical protein VFG53_00185 [Anaeromyxobacter sp.]|nr:hypothetical protein [Anaeromyxobacter sp.]
MRKTLRITSACATLGLALACGSGGGGSGGSFQDELQGSWKGCVPVNASTSTSVTFVISGTTFTATPTGFGTPDCSGVGLQAPAQSGTLSIGSPVNVQLNGQTVSAYEVDQTITSPPAFAGTTYNLAYVDTTFTPNRLYLGDTSGTNDGHDAAHRPTALATALYFAKQ